MTEKFYLIKRLDRSLAVLDVYEVVGETAQYYKIRVNENCIDYVNKKTMYLRGGDSKFEKWTECEVQNYLRRRKLVKFVRNLNVSKLTDSQLERIVKIACE